MDSSTQGRSPRRIRMPRRWWTRAALAGAVLAAIAAPAAWASHTFSDVPTSSPHHTDVTNIADAGITGGCNPPTNNLYCPADPVRRDQMASFLGRGLGRIASEQVNFVTTVPSGTVTTVSDVDIVVPGVAGGEQLLYLQATFTAFANNPAKCDFGIRLHNGPTTGSPVIQATFDEFASATSSQRTFTISDVVLAAAGSRSYALGVVHTCGVNVSISDLNFIAASFPFGWNGTDVVSGSVPTGPSTATTPTG